MAPLILEGATLGEKHRHYNKLLKNAISTDEIQQIKEINYDAPDVDNLFKIDIASANRNVEYILKVLKCEDMLYVSRALKVSLWLIKDNEYENIINPQFIHTQLLPEMTSKAGNKLLLRIRLNLKDERRVEEFCNYYNTHVHTAQKWLPNCSLSFIEQFVEKYADHISCDILTRLCEKSVTILEIFAKKSANYRTHDLILRTAFLLNTEIERYLRIIDSLEEHYIPHFNSKSTHIIMEKSPDIILCNFEKYAYKIDVATFAKHLKKENVKDFLMNHAKNENLKRWFTFENLKHLIYRMPLEDRFNFVKNIFIDKLEPEESNGVKNETKLYCLPIQKRFRNAQAYSNEDIYQWYNFAPFDAAYTDLVKMIRAESNPSERNSMFAVMMISAGGKLENVKRVLQYYRDHHINEPFKFKRQFVNIVLSHSYTHRFDEDTWNNLNDIFCAMEVYSESEVNVQTCVQHVIVYNAVRDLQVPDIIKNKFEFESLKSLQGKLNEQEKKKVFDFLYEFSVSQLKKVKIADTSAFAAAIIHLKNVMNLLVDWKKDLIEFASIIEIIYELIEIKERRSWNEDISDIYNIKKSWRKHMFHKSLLLYPSQEVCINALKHRPEMLEKPENIIDIIYIDPSISLIRCLNKIRIYYSTTLAPHFEKYFLDKISQNLSQNKYKFCISGLCVLLPQKELKDLLINYAPSESKINWRESDKNILTIQQMFARHMLLARPQIPLEVVLMYAKGDFLQYALPTINSVLYNLSCTGSQKHVEMLLDTPVSMQKHGLRFAFTRLNSQETMKICFKSWNSTKNSSIRSIIFKIIFDLLRKQKDESIVREIWLLMASMIDGLTSDENKTVYDTLGKVNQVPEIIRPAFCVKSYTFLKSLPAKTNCDRIMNSVINSTLHIMEFLDEEFVANIIFDSFDENFTKGHFDYIAHISACLLSSRSEASQRKKYDLIFKELLKKYLNLINEEKNQLYLKQNFINVLHHMLSDLNNIVLGKHMITPIKLYEDILCDLTQNIPEEDNYVLLTTWKLATCCIHIIYKYRDSDFHDCEQIGSIPKWDVLLLKVAPEFGEICVQILKDHTEKYFPSIYTLFYKAMKALFLNLNVSDTVELSILKSVHDHRYFIEGQLLVLKALPTYLINNDTNDKEERSKILEALISHPSAEVRIHSKIWKLEN